MYVCMYPSRFSHLTPPAMAPTKTTTTTTAVAPSSASPHSSSHPFSGAKDQFTG